MPSPGSDARRARRRLIERLSDSGIRDSRVLQVIADTPRHRFVDEALGSRAYEDTPLPIGFGQTISQPYIVAYMTELLLEGREPERVLEIGTGSGYQTAVLARLIDKVYSIERIARLLESARERLRVLGIRNVRLKYGDGALGWPRYGPYEGIILTAATNRVPEALLEQLSVGGRLVAPVGSRTLQELQLFERHSYGVERRSLGAVSFVPLLGGVL
ncbi:MAG: protein-L-isoaspartate(D-aspartate) O-methyltransferase [Candidatus Competibacterales bacterium]|nr:protein-L-isoaspartate(D-aspartate) O-methyltransferase [Candidatus Competibacterales bacterium]